MSEDDDKLSADVTPDSMAIHKKRARRINNWPLFIALIVIVVLACVIALVISDRSKGTGEWEVGERRGGGAVSIAKEIAGERSGGIVSPKDVPQIPAPTAKPVVASPLPLPRKQAVPVIPPIQKPQQPVLMGKQTQQQRPSDRPSEEENRLRQRRMKGVEAALDSPIKVNVDERNMAGGRDAMQLEMDRIDRQLENLKYPGTLENDSVTAVSGSNTDSGQGAKIKKRLSASMVEAPPSLYTLRIGSIIPAVLESGINSDLEGIVLARVARDVFDTPTRKHVLIPINSLLVGKYESKIAYGQSRIFVMWESITFPDGKVIELGSFPSSTGEGYSGLRDRVNNHYVRLFGSALLMSGILAGVEMTQNDNNNLNNNNNNNNKTRMSDSLSEALGQTFGNLLAEMFRRNLDISPTLEIRYGYQFHVMVVQDLVFDGPYRAYDYLNNG